MRVITMKLGPIWGQPIMDALSSDTADIDYSDLPPVLLAASSGEAMSRAEKTVSAMGLRIAARLPVEEALSRIEMQPSAAAIWVELDRDCGEPLDGLLRRLKADVSSGSYGGIVSTTLVLIDPVSARIVDSEVELIVDAGEVERTAALAAALAKQRMPVRISEAASDRSAERLRQLSEEVSRIASTLARLSAGPAIPRHHVDQIPTIDFPPLSADTVRNLIRARRLRARYFSEELFADPAWDMLLDLLQAEIAQLRVPVSSLCIAAAVPATTALRWLKTLVSEGLFIRRADPHDGRRVFVELAPAASQALRRYFAEIGALAVI